MMIMIMIMIMIKNLYSARTIKYSEALNIKLQFSKTIPKKLIITTTITKKFHAMQKSKKSKILNKIKI